MRTPAASSCRPVLAGLAALAFLVCGLGGWSVLTTIAGAVIAQGRVEIAGQRRVVQHPEGGVVEQIHVTEGERVTAGALLVTLDGTFQRSELAVLDSQYFEILARRGRLEAEQAGSETDSTAGPAERDARPHFPEELERRAALDPATAFLRDGQLRLFQARAAGLAQIAGQLGQRQAQIASQIAGIDIQSAALAEQVLLAREELARQQDLADRGLSQQARVLALRRDLSVLDGQLGALQAMRAEAEGRITEIGLEIIGLATRRKEEAAAELRELGFREMELAERRHALAERLQRLEIRAPVSGVVHGLQVTTPRSVLRPAEPVAWLVPQDDALVIAVMIRPDDISSVHPGQHAALRFPALAGRNAPELGGVVRLVSADVFQDPATGQSHYRAELALAADDPQAKAVTLVPGMQAEAFLSTRPRRPISYVTELFAR